MKLFPFKRVKVTDGMHLLVSNHFMYTDFGVCDQNSVHTGRRYISTGTPGTGFIERDTESHSYRNFLRSRIAKQNTNYIKFLFGREPNYSRELERAKEALHEAADPVKKQILDCYVNALPIGREAEYIERIIQAIRKKIGNHHSNKFLVSVMSHYKHRVSLLGHDMRAVELHVKDLCTPEQYEAYQNMVKKFAKMAAVRRTWCKSLKHGDDYDQVFFDMGIFDFVRNDEYLPIMRDSGGIEYYFLPTCLLVVRSSVDFDVIPIKDLTIVCQERNIQETVESISSRVGDAAITMQVMQIHRAWMFNHMHAIIDFVAAYDKLKSLQ